MSRLFWAAAGAAACIGSAATASPIVFSGYDANANGNFANMVNSQAAQLDFLSNLTGVGVEDLEGFGGQYIDSADGTVLDFGVAGTATLSSPNSSFVDTDFGSAGPGRFPTSGSVYLDTDTSSGGFTIDFSAPVAAFGFYGTDFGDFNGQIELTLSNGASQTYTIGETSAPDGNGLFWGIIDSAGFTSATFLATSGSDAFGFDDFIVGSLQQVIPLPAPVAMAGLGLLGVGVMRRRRFAD